jgi:phage tail tape-measure protein
MTDAYVMLNCELGAETEIIDQLKEIEQVVDVFETIGTHDMMVKLQAENFEKIREIVSWNIQKLKKVRSTATLIKKDNIDNMIASGDDLVDNLKTVLPNSLSESMVMFHESNVANLKKIKEFLNK